MVRKLKYHEQKLLKKVDFITWKLDSTVHEANILRKYHILQRDDYSIYGKLARNIREIVGKLNGLQGNHPFKIESLAQLGEKLYMLGLTHKKDLSKSPRVTAESFCRRRLPVRMVKTKMARTITEATNYVQQGHVRVGPEVVKDPAFLITRSMEDFLTWVDTSAIKRHIMEYNEVRDDYEMQ